MKQMVTLETGNYSVSMEGDRAVDFGWEFIESKDGVEVWREKRENQDRWYHAVSEDAAVGKRVLFDAALRQEYEFGIHENILNRLKWVMQNELKPNGDHFVEVTFKFDWLGEECGFEVNEIAERDMCTLLLRDDYCMHGCEDIVWATCRAKDVEKVKPLMMTKMRQQLLENGRCYPKRKREFDHKYAIVKEFENNQAEQTT